MTRKKLMTTPTEVSYRCTRIPKGIPTNNKVNGAKAKLILYCISVSIG
jgi:hypothetical protein